MSEKDKPRVQWSATEIVGIGIDNPKRVRKTEDGNTVLMPTGVFGVSLADIPRREPKEEVCEHCGATYTGLFHCQSLSQIKEIDDSEFIAALQRAVEEMSDELG